MSAQPDFALDEVRLALHNCDINVADDCAEIVALASAAKSHLALKPESILAVAQLLALIAEKAQCLTGRIDGIASEHGVGGGTRRDEAFQSDLYRQYHALRAAGPVLQPAGARS